MKLFVNFSWQTEEQMAAEFLMNSERFPKPSAFSGQISSRIGIPIGNLGADGFDFYEFIKVSYCSYVFSCRILHNIKVDLRTYIKEYLFIHILYWVAKALSKKIFQKETLKYDWKKTSNWATALIVKDYIIGSNQFWSATFTILTVYFCHFQQIWKRWSCEKHNFSKIRICFHKDCEPIFIDNAYSAKKGT